MSFTKSCKYCRKNFTSNQSKAVFCGTGCRVKSHRLLKGYKLIDEDVPEDIVKAHYLEWLKPPYYNCDLFLRWFRVKFANGTIKRYADVYVNKDFKIDGLEERDMDAVLRRINNIGVALLESNHLGTTR
jgi:hypothetical protein